MALRIALAATNLVLVQPRVPTKLTFAALQELLSEAEEVVCQQIPETSGNILPQNSELQFLPSSQLPSRK